MKKVIVQVGMLCVLVFSQSGFTQELPVCVSPASDSDGDGFGFENDESCVVGSITASDTANSGLPVCVSPASDPDGDGFGFENDESCVVGSTESPDTVNSVLPVCVSSASDSDGDGFGFENNQSCTVVSSAPIFADDASLPVSLPVCVSSASDPDGDGFGFENNQSCTVVSSAPIFSDDASLPVCVSSASDPDGDGFGFENNQSCTVVSSAPIFADDASLPVCVSSASDTDGDGFGFENNQSCTVSTDGDTDTVVDGGDTDTVVDGGDTDTVVDGGDIDTVVDGGDTDTVVDGGDTDTVVDGGDTDTVVDGGDTDSVVDGGDTDTVIDPNICCLQEDRTPPVAGSVITSSSAPIVPNGVGDAPDAGPQPISIDNNNSFPGLRFGDFLMLNNAFNAGNTSWTDWRQAISLNDGSPVTVDVDWDWGLESQKGQPFETIAFPELVFGTKSPGERSGDFQQTGLPVEEANRPDITITYDYSRTEGVTAAPAGANDNPADSEHNVIIESFWHDSCTIVRNGGPDDNQVMEMLIWYYHGERLPSGPADIVATGVMIDGFPWTVYRKTSNFNFLAYVAEDVESAERMSGTIDYSAFIEDTIANASTYDVYQIQPTDCFANILIGPEVFQGAGTFTINNFEVTRTY